MVTEHLLDGSVGGLVATIVMTVFMMALGDDSPPPTALFWSKYVGDGPPTDYMLPGMALHLLYGVVAGAVFAVGLAVLLPDLSGPAVLTAAGLGYGVVLFVGAAVFWMRLVLGMEPDRKMAGTFLLFHLIYGAVLGGFVGLELL